MLAQDGGIFSFGDATFSGSVPQYATSDWINEEIVSMAPDKDGVGYVIVRYRKNGVLRRLKATPLKAHEFLLAQVFARLVILMGVFLIVFLWRQIWSKGRPPA